MSRLLGRSFDVYNISKELQDSKIKKYKDDTSKTTWKSIEESPEKYDIYLPDSAIYFLKEKKIKICWTPFLVYTEMQIPEDDVSDRYIKFPSTVPREKFKAELAYYLGMLLAYHQNDEEEDLYSFPKEYTDLLPLLVSYLYFKTAGKEEEFSKKHLSVLSKYVGSYISDYEAYNDFCEFERNTNTSMISEKEYDNLMGLISENEEKMASATAETLIQLSSFDGALQIIDRCNSPDDFKKYIELLFLNERHDRSSLLRDQGIESYGYKRLRKEIENYKRK